jgi:hypothetical protein
MFGVADYWPFTSTSKGGLGRRAGGHAGTMLVGFGVKLAVGK